jgi:hypothetical protein
LTFWPDIFSVYFPLRIYCWDRDESDGWGIRDTGGKSASHRRLVGTPEVKILPVDTHIYGRITLKYT